MNLAYRRVSLVFLISAIDINTAAVTIMNTTLNTNLMRYVPSDVCWSYVMHGWYQTGLPRQLAKSTLVGSSRCSDHQSQNGLHIESFHPDETLDLFCILPTTIHKCDEFAKGSIGELVNGL